MRAGSPDIRLRESGGISRLVRLACLAAALVPLIDRAAAAESDLRLVPFPKELRLEPGQFRFRPQVILAAPATELDTLATLLNEELGLAGLPTVRPQPAASAVPILRLAAAPTDTAPPALPAEGGPEAYALAVGPQAIVAAGREPAGLIRAVQTLRQLIRANRQGDALPGLVLRDWPALRWRAFQDDLTRGPSSTLDTLRFETSLGAYLKFNLATYYMEYQFAFAKHPDIGPTNGSLAPADLAAWAAHARPLHLDVLGNQQSFGHFGRILQIPAYAHLRETADIVNPAREEAYQLLDDFYSEICPQLPFPWFNVCCDETYGLGTGPAKDLAAQLGPGGLYVRHLRRIHDILRDRHGKRMMMWGDIILQHPTRLVEIPKDTLMLTWGYDARPSFEDQILPFARSGFDFFVCPGVNNWSRILPDFGVAITNIAQFVRDGVRHGALGMINTDWEDDGEALNAVKWHADAWAAECAWNGSATPLDHFNRRVGAVLFGEPGDRFGHAVAALAQLHRHPALKGLFNSRFWEDDFAPRSNPAALRRAATDLLAVVRPARAQLEACRQEAVVNQHILDVFIFGARRIERIGRRMLDGLTAAELYCAAYAASLPAPPSAAPPTPPPSLQPAIAQTLEPIESLVRQNREAHADLGRQFADLWLRESKPYALDWTLQRYTNTVARYDALLRQITAARTAAANRQTLPPPEAVGLAIPRPLSRLRPPQTILTTPLSPDSPWLDPHAPQRLGLTVQAGTRDRVELPVEVELPPVIPRATGAVRVFHLTPDGPRELLAQIDPALSSEPGDSPSARPAQRLTFLLPGRLPREAEAALHLYLDTTALAPPPGAVVTRPGPSGTHWLENDRVRLLLGPEGGHVYRWELKSAANRDLTMPGDSGWAGFSDQGSLRHTPHRLDCTARGPALAEFVCMTELGQGKTLRLYAGADWIEVMTFDPTPIYWDFDDPRNFAADGPTPGTWLFSNGKSGPLGREADGVPAQIEAADTLWGLKYNSNRIALASITPGRPALHHVAPGAGAGGVGIEHSTPAQHFVTFAGVLTDPPAETMNRLESTLDLTHPVTVRVHARQARPTTAP